MKILTSLLFNFFAGIMLASVLGIGPAFGGVVSVIVSFIIGRFIPNGVLSATVFKEIWTGELIKSLREKESSTFLDGIPDMSKYVGNDVIHAVEVGVNPDVLINNTTYPIDVVELPDGDKTFSLDKYQTTATPITDDELYAASYDKMASVRERHANAIDDTKFAKALHSLAPNKDDSSKGAFVIETSGEVSGTRHRLTREDIISLKAKFDSAKLPRQGRRLVLSSDHISDLLSQDQKFAQQYYDYTSGKIANLYGFEIYEGVTCPLYVTAGTKKAYALAAAATDREASVAFITGNCFKATGSTKVYTSKAENDPQYQRNLLNFRHYFVAMPKKTSGCAAILSKVKA